MPFDPEKNDVNVTYLSSRRLRENKNNFFLSKIRGTCLRCRFLPARSRYGEAGGKQVIFIERIQVSLCS